MKFFLSTIRQKLLKGKRPGETLIEVIMAIFVVAVGSAAATSLIVTAIQANSFSRDNLIALNLAVEGIEAMRNVRDSNWLRFGFDKENCWNLDPEQTACTALTITTSAIDAGDYTVDLNPNTFQWTLTKITTGALNLADGTSDADYQLNYVDATAADSDGNGVLTDDPDLYVSKNIVVALTLVSTGESKFYRSIVVTYPAVCPSLNKCMDITSTVQWKVGNRVDKVQLKSSLTNYDKVKKS